MRMIDNELHAVVVGRIPDSSLPSVDEPESVPPGARLIVVEWFAEREGGIVKRLRERHPTARILAWQSAPTEESSSFFEYLMLGVEHLLTGWDHLIFVIGLLILFGWHRRLIAAVTAFTVGHSITLALAVLGILAVPQIWVEALIALTIVVLALEIQSGKHGPVWKHPWSLPGSLGLLHGLGFASVLFDAGLPSDDLHLGGAVIDPGSLQHDAYRLPAHIGGIAEYENLPLDFVFDQGPEGDDHGRG